MIVKILEENDIPKATLEKKRFLKKVFG